jgi:hypothetical protein
MNATKRIDQYVTGFPGWRGEQLAKLREWIGAAVPDLEASWKWRIPVWTGGGNVVGIGACKDHVKANFEASGAA